jgi:hypothetical protein
MAILTNAIFDVKLILAKTKDDEGRKALAAKENRGWTGEVKERIADGCAHVLYKRMTTSRKISLLFIIGPLAWVFLLAGCTLADTPRRSLAELRTALLDHDAERALRYIDTDSVVDCLARDIFLKYEKKADTPLEALGAAAGRQATALMLPEIKKLVRQQLKEAIASSDEAGYFDDIRKASVWYLNIRVEGDIAIVAPRGKSDIRFKMARTSDGHWRIVEIIRKQSAGARPAGEDRS